jgi:hypothetical protein
VKEQRRAVIGTTTRPEVLPATHCIDPVWDKVRMNNIAQHVVTAFLGKHLDKDAAKAAHLDVLEYAKKASGQPTRTAASSLNTAIGKVSPTVTQSACG